MTHLWIGAAEPLTIEGLRAASNRIGTSAAALLAVMEVEARGCGFNRDRSLVALYERHVFHRETDGVFDKVAPNLSSPISGGYGPAGPAQHEKIQQAMDLDETAALRSASWGLGQIMGFNARLVGYEDAPAMIRAFADSEDEQVMAIAEYIVRRGLADELRRRDWRGFAFGYNGPKYAVHHYHEKIAAAFQKHDRPRSVDIPLRAKQVRLMFAGLYSGAIDGIDGPRTRAALIAAARQGVEV